jgi:hypothetical protein
LKRRSAEPVAPAWPLILSGGVAASSIQPDAHHQALRRRVRSRRQSASSERAMGDVAVRPRQGGRGRRRLELAPLSPKRFVYRKLTRGKPHKLIRSTASCVQVVSVTAVGSDLVAGRRFGVEEEEETVEAKLWGGPIKAGLQVGRDWADKKGRCQRFWWCWNRNRRPGCLLRFPYVDSMALGMDNDNRMQGGACSGLLSGYVSVLTSY